MENIKSAQVVLSCDDLAASMEFFRERLSFRLERSSPADDPQSALLAGHGVRLLLRRGEGGSPAVLQLDCEDPALLGGALDNLVAPNGRTSSCCPRIQRLRSPMVTKSWSSPDLRPSQIG
ncbi:MAG: catechol 2,3-dioxygenase-like lactoylglutathione lyase family enzyme [Planctomycetota bacterium]|jgi:catechol 2,3-dioxygenase-like lactoylglutathione lyase family enzyme